MAPAPRHAAPGHHSSRHIVLAGDSVFDNDIYVMGRPGVIEQMRRSLPVGWSARKVAVDGHCIRDVARQVTNLGPETTDLIVSVGGNDALRHAHLLDIANSRQEIEALARGPAASFAAEYGAMLDQLQPLPVRCAVCTIYTAIPFPQPAWRLFAPAAIGYFNDAIMEQARKRGVPVLRLDRVCIAPEDFSAASPIEPSAEGGQKIVDHILAFLCDDRTAPSR